MVWPLPNDESDYGKAAHSFPQFYLYYIIKELFITNIPTQEEANKTMTGVKLVKIDTEKYPSIASQFHVAALPTLVLFKNGKAVARQEGVLGATDLQRWVQNAAQRAKSS